MTHGAAWGPSPQRRGMDEPEGVPDSCTASRASRRVVSARSPGAASRAYRRRDRGSRSSRARLAEDERQDRNEQIDVRDPRVRRARRRLRAWPTSHRSISLDECWRRRTSSVRHVGRPRAVQPGVGAEPPATCSRTVSASPRRAIPPDHQTAIRGAAASARSGPAMCRAAGAAAGRASAEMSGSLIVTVVPAPGSLAIDSRPPCRSTTLYRPRGRGPCPLLRREERVEHLRQLLARMSRPIGDDHLHDGVVGHRPRAHTSVPPFGMASHALMMTLATPGGVDRIGADGRHRREIALEHDVLQRDLVVHEEQRLVERDVHVRVDQRSGRSARSPAGCGRSPCTAPSRAGRAPQLLDHPAGLRIVRAILHRPDQQLRGRRGCRRADC